MDMKVRITNIVIIFLMFFSVLLLPNMVTDTAEATTRLTFDGLGSCTATPYNLGCIHISWEKVSDMFFGYYQVKIKTPSSYYYYPAKGMEVDENGKIYDRSSNHATITGYYKNGVDYDLYAGDCYYIKLIHNSDWGTEETKREGYSIADEIDLSLSETSSGGVKVSWTNHADYFNDYNNDQEFDFEWVTISRRKGSYGSFKSIKTIYSKYTTSYIDTSVEPDTKYYYKVSIYDEFQLSDGGANCISSPSEIKSITTPPKGTITLSSPNGGETWELGKRYKISWSSTGSVSYVKIKLYKSGHYHSTITSSTYNDGDYYWTVPSSQTESSRYKIMIEDTSDPTITDYSSSYFTIEEEKTIELTSPNGGENWKPGSSHYITWTSTGSISNVEIELYKNSILDYTITSSTSNDGSYRWTIPSSQSDSNYYRIRLEATCDPYVYDCSKNSFTIKDEKELSLVNPNGGEDWEAGSSHYIQWTSSGDISNVKITLYKGRYYDSTITSSTSNDGIYRWNIPSSQSGSEYYRVHIEDTSDSSIDSLSDAYFTIEEKGSLKVTSPNGGEDWEPGTNHYIEWSSTGDIDQVKIEVYKSGVYYSTISSRENNDGKYYWKINSNMPDNDYYKIKISSTSDSSITDTSNNYFTVQDFTLRLTSPNGGESWKPGTSHYINWDKSKSTGNVQIKLFKEKSYDSTIVRNTDNDGSYYWTIPSSQKYSDEYKVKITSLSNGYVYDYSDNYFTIGTKPTLELTSPNGGETWKIDDSNYIKWKSTGSIGNVEIKLYKNGYYHSTISSGTSNDGSYKWTIPKSQKESDYYKIKIESTSDSTVNDDSDNYFSISEKDSLSLTSLNSGGSFEPNEQVTIKWDKTGSIGNVKITLYKKNYYDSTITYGTSNDGSYTWTIPTSQEDSTYYKIKIEDTSNSGVYDLSNSYFTINDKRSISIISPNGGEELTCGKPHTIKWDTTGDISNVKISLYKSESFDSTITSSTNNDGSYSWNIPNTQKESNYYRIKIESTNDKSINKVSHSYFKIVEEKNPSITVTKPNGNEEWLLGSTQEIKWDSKNIGSYVKIKLYKNGNYKSTIVSSTSNDGTYSWTVPSSLTEGDYYKIKIESTSDSSINDYSDNYFTIRKKANPTIRITQPISKDSWELDTNHYIKWSSEDFTDDVTIKLYKNGYSYKTIANSENNDGSYYWKIDTSLPDCNYYQIKIISNSDSSVSDTSDYFSISEKKSLKVTSPNGNERWGMGSTHKITWDSTALVGKVKIDLYRSRYYKSTIISSTENDGEFLWKIPTNTYDRNYYKIKIVSVSDSSVYDESDNYFGIIEETEDEEEKVDNNNETEDNEKETKEKQTITLTSPNGGESLKAGTKHNIKWDSTGSGSYVMIRLYKLGYYESTIVSKTNNDGSYTWTIPTDIRKSNYYKINISIKYTTVSDTSNSYFSIEKEEKETEEDTQTKKSTISVTSPNGRETWTAGSNHYIRWNSEGSTHYVRIDLYKDGDYYSNIHLKTLNDGRHLWKVPSSLKEGDNYKIRITSTSDYKVTDYSDKSFSIDKKVSRTNSNNKVVKTSKEDTDNDDKQSVSSNDDDLSDNDSENKNPGYYGMKVGGNETDISAVPAFGAAGMIIAVIFVFVVLAVIKSRKD